MIFSVYDYPTRKYRYYEAPAQLPAAGWFREPALGALPTPESIAAPLPPNAKYIGEGEKARGVVAHTGQGQIFAGLVPLKVPRWSIHAALLGFAFWLGRATK